MNIQFGSIEYFELLSFQDKLKGCVYDKFDLHHLDLLRVEVARKIGAINLIEQRRREAKEARLDRAWGALGTTLYEGERDGLGV